MNFLAHLLLSGTDEKLLVGNFIADFLTRRQAGRFPLPIRRGVAVHHQIDAFTDRHPMVRQGVRRLYADHGKYAPVVIDVFYDHLLAVNWARYHDRPLPEFARWAYQVLEAHQSLLPPSVEQRLSLMIADDWLLSYTHLEGIAYAFERMKHRASRPELLDGAVDSLRRDFEQLDEEFNRFFPEMLDFLDKEGLIPRNEGRS